jgi:hypothetical protein
VATGVAKVGRRDHRPASGRPSDTTRVLLRASRRDLSLGDLQASASPPLARALAAACLWPARGHRWQLGDYNFLILSTRPEPGVSLFTQWWSEPLELVAVEACSARSNPGARHYVGAPARKVLRRLGFEHVAGSPNYRKTVSVKGVHDVRSLAREALDVFHDAFGYRGRTRLDLQIVRDRRTRPELVLDAVTPEDVAKLVTARGSRAEVKVSKEGRPFVFVAADPPWLVHFPWHVADSNLCAALHFYQPISRPPAVDAGLVNRVNDGLLFGRVIIDDDGDLALAMDARVDGGVTIAWLSSVVDQWRAVMSEAQARLRSAKENLATIAAAAELASWKGLLRE